MDFQRGEKASRVCGAHQTPLSARQLYWAWTTSCGESEVLLDLATGLAPMVAKQPAVGADRVAHPDAQRRFRVMTKVEESASALKYPWARWTIFLNPSQRTLVERNLELQPQRKLHLSHRRGG